MLNSLTGSADELSNRIRAITLMTQLIQEAQKEGIHFMENKSMDIPALMITDALRSELRREDERVLLNYGFIKFIEISRKDDILILPKEVDKTLKKVAKKYPYTLQTMILSPCKNFGKTFSVIIIMEEIPTIGWITDSECSQLKPPTYHETLKHWAHIAETICETLSNGSQKWYTLYLSSTTIIQSNEIIENGTVEKMEAQQTPIRIEIPSTIAEVTLIGLSDPGIQQEAQKMMEEDSDLTADATSTVSEQLAKQ